LEGKKKSQGPSETKAKGRREKKQEKLTGGEETEKKGRSKHKRKEEYAKRRGR